jgi:hypothetical protein
MHRLKSLTLLRWVLAIVGLAALSSCVVEEGPRPIPDGGPRYCTAEYVPVCASDGNDRRTFSNACMARRAGYDVERRGECRRERPEQPRACTMEYVPVCAVQRGDRRTFANRCAAGRKATGWSAVANAGGRYPMRIAQPAHENMHPFADGAAAASARSAMHARLA